MSTENSASTTLLDLQRQRESAEARRAQAAAQRQHYTLMAKGRESSASHGVVLMDSYGEQYAKAVDALLSSCLINPERSGKHMAAWPLLLHFCDRGPRVISLVVLRTVVDTISRSPLEADLAERIGRALLAEKRATEIAHQRGYLLLNAIRRRYGRGVSWRTIKQLGIDSDDWTRKQRRELGCLLLSLLEASTDLIAISRGQRPVVSPTPQVLALIKAMPERSLPPRPLISIVPLEPWTDFTRNGIELVHSRRPMDKSHLTAASLATAFRVVNHLESQPLRLDPWMVALQREAWDSNMPHLFPIRRDPESNATKHAQCNKRLRLEASIAQGELVAGRTCWMRHELDFRGRVYCATRTVCHQGPDNQKAMVEFRHGEPVDDEALGYLFAAAAAHYGLSRSSWEERRQWGQENVQLMRRVVEAPLDRADLWHGASDPWQFLQTARGVCEALDGKPVSVPVRFDQTCSGMGILACLCRDAGLGALTNITGKRRQDLYLHVCDLLTTALRHDLDSEDERTQELAEFWLGRGVTRSLMKLPVMATAYGAKDYGIADGFVTELMGGEDVPRVSLWSREFIRPAAYLADRSVKVINTELSTCIAVEKWLRCIARDCSKAQVPIRWESPAGFPVSLSAEQPRKLPTTSLAHGRGRWYRPDAGYRPGLLSGRESARGVGANAIHSFDAAFCHLIACRAALHQAPLLTNHDCFATLPSRAGWLHRTLHWQLRELYLTDWLTKIHEQLGEPLGKPLPLPPIVGDLLEAKIGENPYCFS